MLHELAYILTKGNDGHIPRCEGTEATIAGNDVPDGIKVKLAKEFKFQDGESIRYLFKYQNKHEDANIDGSIYVGITDYRLIKWEKFETSASIQLASIARAECKDMGRGCWDRLILTMTDGTRDSLGIYNHADCKFFASTINNWRDESERKQRDVAERRRIEALERQRLETIERERREELDRQRRAAEEKQRRETIEKQQREADERHRIFEEKYQFELAERQRREAAERDAERKTLAATIKKHTVIRNRCAKKLVEQNEIIDNLQRRLDYINGRLADAKS